MVSAKCWWVVTAGMVQNEPDRALSRVFELTS